MGNGRGPTRKLIFLLVVVLTFVMAAYQFPYDTELWVRETEKESPPLNEAKELTKVPLTVSRARPITWDTKAPTWQLWKDDNESSPCRQYRTRFAKGLPMTYLLSFPGSGNTWIRYLLEGSSGIFTGSVYVDGEIRDAGYLGEADRADSGRTLVQKTHAAALRKSPTDILFRYKQIRINVPVLMIVRDPNKAFISYWKYLHGVGRGSHTNQVSDGTYKTKEFRTFVEKMILLWEQLITDRLLWQTAPIYIVYYENLLKDPINEIRGMLQFLRVPIDEGRLSCVESHLRGSFKRPETKVFDPFTYNEKKTMKVAVDRVIRLLGLRGLPEPPPYELLLNIR